MTRAHRRAAFVWAAFVGAARSVVLGAFVFALAASLAPTSAQAVKHRRPFNNNLALGYGYDHNGSAAGCTNYACGGGTCYNGHTGSDFPLPYGTDVLAGANGSVTTVVQGCSDVGYYGNTCGGKCGNYVKLVHSDGTTSIYCHMKNGSIVVSKGQSVSCGQKLGKSASSGSSTGNHLHFGWNSGGTRDPFSGGCSTGGGWVSQGGFGSPVGTGCEVTCQCTPGQTQSQGCGKCGSKKRTCGGNCLWGGWSGCTGQGACSAGQKQSQGCGNCGSQSRTCKGNCKWGGWGACGGQGPCAPGQVETEACCDCGSRARSCGGTCKWGGWSTCDGPDPVGQPTCPTGGLGECGIGLTKCQAGCLVCTEWHVPEPESCDGKDNDCDGTTDEDATEMGEVPPALAARVEDYSAPAQLPAGESAWVWARVRNVGLESWPAGASWLFAQTLLAESLLAESLLAETPPAEDGAAEDGDPEDGDPEDGDPEAEPKSPPPGSPLWSAETWSAHDAPAVCEDEIAPGESAWLSFLIHMPLTTEPQPVATRFSMRVTGEPILCPEPDFIVDPSWAPAAGEPAAQSEPGRMTRPAPIPAPRATSGRGVGVPDPEMPDSGAALDPDADPDVDSDAAAPQDAVDSDGMAAGDATTGSSDGGEASAQLDRGGCRAARPGSAGGAWWLLGVSALALFRRRRASPRPPARSA